MGIIGGEHNPVFQPVPGDYLGGLFVTFDRDEMHVRVKNLEAVLDAYSPHPFIEEEGNRWKPLFGGARASAARPGK